MEWQFIAELPAADFLFKLRLLVSNFKATWNNSLIIVFLHEFVSENVGQLLAMYNMSQRSDWTSAVEQSLPPRNPIVPLAAALNQQLHPWRAVVA